MATGKRLTAPIGNILNLSKTTTTQSITQDDICYLASGLVAVVASAGDCTTTAVLVVAESRSASGESRKVQAVLPDLQGPDYDYDLNTATSVAVGDLVKWSAAKTLAKASSAGEQRIGMVIKTEADATRVRCRFFPPSYTK